MNFERVLEKFKEYILAVGIKDLTVKDIFLPNTVFDSNGKTLWVELSASRGRTLFITEKTSRLPAEINIIVGVPLQSGTKKANHIVDMISSKFSVANNAKWNCFFVEKNKVYVTGVNVLSGVTDSSGYRINVRISLDIYLEG